MWSYAVMYVSSCCYKCARMLPDMCPHAALYVSSGRRGRCTFVCFSAPELKHAIALAKLISITNAYHIYELTNLMQKENEHFVPQRRNIRALRER